MLALRSIALLGLLTLQIAGCSHDLVIKNLDSFRTPSRAAPRGLTIGIRTQTGTPETEYIVAGLVRYLETDNKVVYPYAAHKGYVDIILDVSIRAKYEGSGWNYLLTFPGYLVFAPAWNGYIYQADYDIDVSFLKPQEKKSMVAIKIPVTLDLRHSELDRTWTEGTGWCLTGAIPLIGGLFFIRYDTDITPQLNTKIQVPLGQYVADKIIGNLIAMQLESQPLSITPAVVKIEPIDEVDNISRRLLFFDVQIDPSTPNLAGKGDLLSKVLQNDLVGIRGVKILDRSTRDTLFRQRKLNLEDCSKQECRFAMVKAVGTGVDLMVESSIESAGSQCAFTLSIKSIKTGLIEATEFELMACDVSTAITTIRKTIGQISLSAP